MMLDINQIRTIYTVKKPTINFAASRYDKAYRIAAVKLSKELNNVARAATRLGVAPATVREFIRQSDDGLLD